MAGAPWVNVYLLSVSKLGLAGWLFQEAHGWDVALVPITVPGIHYVRCMDGWMVVA